MATYPTRLRRWTRAEYERLIEIGVFRPGEPVELLGGELMVSEPQGSAHYTAIGPSAPGYSGLVLPEHCQCADSKHGAGHRRSPHVEE